MFNVRLKIEHKYYIIILGAICTLCWLFIEADGLPRWSPHRVLSVQYVRALSDTTNLGNKVFFYQ